MNKKNMRTNILKYIHLDDFVKDVAYFGNDKLKHAQIVN